MAKNEKYPRMYQSEFTTALADRTGLSKAEADRITREFLELLKDAMCTQRSVCFRSFGVFELRPMPEKMARNPKTMEEYPVPPGYKPVFRVSKEVRKYITEQILNNNGG